MITLNLTANNNAEQKIKDYLEQNVSTTLADKINNGVQVQKDNLTLLQRKDLMGFMQYASNEAQKLVEQNARSAYIDDQTVYGWAIHYFEEDSIAGELYNLDGSKYETPVVKPTPKPTIQKSTTPQISLFDNPQDTQKEDTDDVWGENSFDQAMQTTITAPPQINNQPKDNYPEILKQILNGKLGVAL